LPVVIFIVFIDTFFVLPEVGFIGTVSLASLPLPLLKTTLFDFKVCESVSTSFSTT
jgi:hypothetical protein